jgi:hypothetical protein
VLDLLTVLMMMANAAAMTTMPMIYDFFID